MHRQAFPLCTVAGPLDPVPFAHLVFRGAIETQARLDRDFIALFGPERDAPRCRHESCSRGAVAHSALCKRPHFESIQRRPYPFED